MHPSVIYKSENLIRLATLPGPDAPKDWNLYLRPIVSELSDLETNGLICIYLVPLVTCLLLPCLLNMMAISQRMGVESARPRLYPSTMADYINDDPVKNISSGTVFSILKTFAGPTFFGLDEMHLIGQG
ncbi:hypothetical protein CU098_010874, partial [Rhizopus stolonifer]